MTDLLIIGGGYSDIFDLIEDINSYKKKINIIAIIDRKRTHLKKLNGYKVIKDIKNLKFKKKPYLLNGVASNFSDREKVFKEYRKKFKFFNLIHPHVKVSNLKLGEGNIICAQSFFGKRCILKNNVIIGPQSFVGHDTKIGNNCIIGPATKIMGSVKIKDNVTIGAASTILQNLTVGDGSLISMGSVVFNDLKKNSRVIGNPAR